MKVFSTIKKELINNKYDYLLICFFIGITAVLRFTPIITGNFPFLFDHGRDMLEVKKIVVEHKPTLIGPFTGMQGVFQGPYHYYLLAIAFVFSGGNPASGTYFMAILGVFGVFLCYVLGAKIVDRKFGLLAALFFAIAPASIAFSQHFWNPHWIPFLMILYYFFLFKSIYKNEKYLIPTFISIGLMAQVEAADGIWMVPVTILSLLFFKRSVFSHRWIWISFFAYAMLFIPQVLFDLRHQFLMTHAVISLFQGKNESLGAVIPLDVRFPMRINELTYATVFALSKDQLSAWIFALTGIGYLFYAIKNKKIKNIEVISLFLLTPLVYFIVFLIFPRPAWAWYWIGLQVSYYFIMAFVISRILIFGGKIKFIMLILLCIWAVFTIASNKTFPLRDDPGTGIYKNELRVIDAIYKDANGEKFGEFVYTPPIYDYAYQYLFWWRGTSKYNYVPGKDKNGIFYLIIEPDKERPLASKGWKETVIKTGKVEWNKVFPGQITVEKRRGN